jgi:hypothetical protein
MLSAASVLLFTLAAMAALGSIITTLKAYGAEVSALRARVALGEGECRVVWRIVEPAPCHAGVTAPAPAARVRLPVAEHGFVGQSLAA